MNLQNATMGNFRGKSTHVNMEKLIEVIEMIGCVIALIVLAVFALYLFVDGLWTHTELDIAKSDINELYEWINEHRERFSSHKELIEALSKSVRELNGVVEAAVKDKEQTSDNKPDTKALIGGWTTETTLLDDVLAKIRKKKEKPVDDTYYLGVGVDDDKMLRIPVRDTGQTLVDGEPIRHGRLWTNSEGRIYELPEGCYISGDTSYEMDQ